MEDRKLHWENVYNTKQPNEVSWTQDVPQTSLDFIHGLNLSKNASIIDIGGGDSKLVDFLLEEGYTDITVLDISEKALERAKKRLGEKASKVNWIVSDITTFAPDRQYDVWHDRAVFHFLTVAEQISKYKAIVEKVVAKNMIIGTFSDEGPKKCSGLDVQQYNETSLPQQFADSFDTTECKRVNHTTPFDTTQNFIFCVFKKQQN